MESRVDVLGAALDRARIARRLPAPEVRQLLRERAGIVQEDLARELEVSRASICRWESGIRTPRGRNLARYVEVLDRLARESLQ